MNLISFWQTAMSLVSSRSSPRSRPENPEPRLEVPNFLPMDPGDEILGLVLQGRYLPEEILRLILSFVDEKSLLQCRAVCKYWRYEIDNEVWKYKIRHDRSLNVPESAVNLIANSIPNSWLDFYAISTHKPFGKNLLRNCSGQDKLKFWKILSNGGNKWHIENPPAGSENLPEEVGLNQNGPSNSCFVTSYHSCSKRQTIHLKNVGLTSAIMDIIQPSIHICEWYARRWDCGAVYEMRVELQDANQVAVKEFEHRVTMNEEYGNDWHKVSHEFVKYGPGVRYVMFYHGGTDTQFWAGHYGSKMAGARVIVELPTEPVDSIA